MTLNSWSKEIEEELILLIKDWLRQMGKTQSELCQSLGLPSTRMPALIDFLKKDFFSGGVPQVAHRLCEIESLWRDQKGESPNEIVQLNSSSQLDLLDEICEDLSKINFKK
tara:strand:+ start:271 stop:603 length:333 start_codon:yes stop_codon:yes gene_type:complete